MGMGMRRGREFLGRVSQAASDASLTPRDPDWVTIMTTRIAVYSK